MSTLHQRSRMCTPTMKTPINNRIIPQSFPKQKRSDNQSPHSQPLFPIGGAPSYPGAKQIQSFLDKSKITETELSVEHVEMLLNVLILDGEIEKVWGYMINRPSSHFSIRCPVLVPQCGNQRIGTVTVTTRTTRKRRMRSGKINLTKTHASTSGDVPVGLMMKARTPISGARRAKSGKRMIAVIRLRAMRAP